MAVLFVAVFGVSGVITWLTLNAPVDQGAEASLAREASAIESIYEQHPRDVAARMIRDRERRPRGFNFRLADATGRRFAGDLPEQDYPLGYFTLQLDASESIDADDLPQQRLRVLTLILKDGAHLSVAEDLELGRQLKGSFLRSFILTSGAALFIALAVGLSYVSRTLGRIEVIGDTADAIADGDLTRRAPVRAAPSRDDIDQLAIAINRMLDRIETLVLSVRQVSDDVAHDLRTPLAHLKQRVESALAGRPSVEAYRDALEGASDKIDEVLATFEALLRIGQLEAGANLTVFHPVDVSQLAAAVVEAFRPSAEDSDRRLTLASAKPARVLGDRSLITQLVANLVENALIHTPAGSTVEVRVETLGDGVRLIVEDDGPGVPPDLRTAIFRRFYRVERSRTTPGSGLGLSLAAAVARAHGGVIRAEDAEPGLRIVVDFPAAIDIKSGDAASPTAATPPAVFTSDATG